MNKNRLNETDNFFNPNIACEMLQFSTNENFVGIQQKSINFITENFKECLLSESFLKIGIKTLETILKLDIIEVDEETSEVFIFDRLMELAKSKRSSSHITGSTKREILKDIVTFINFPSLTLSEFKRCIENEPNFLTPDEILEIRNEIVNGTKNSRGFSDLKRFHFDYKTSVLDRRVFTLYHYPAGYFTSKIQSFNTKFTMNKNFKLCGIQITVPAEKAEKQKHVKVLVYDQQLKFYLNQNFKMHTYTTSEECWFNPIELNGDVEYTIELKFQNPDVDFQPWANRIVPFTASRSGFSIEFNEICMLMNSVYVL